ncbi:uncharacterized protein L969DRAFT_15861 [Mixia osmundae IAM 14324]|uniref:uncharacterized protein n=1 Tax=Mixia osmundae (strain CBS 9802 / IAM 14324 / JCM 22182 / KY 12970) TaxID=764103 RepID=UPI0004A5491C|nr:uncharacterized protein L969DRAFT_15861 [Mixia osmundae IAM 14324]KEI40501.1 hypothetical protein L969DRAFT_15861 [Mixia osmundae IAM 14324]
MHAVAIMPASSSDPFISRAAGSDAMDISDNMTSSQAGPHRRQVSPRHAASAGSPVPRSGTATPRSAMTISPTSHHHQPGMLCSSPTTSSSPTQMVSASTSPTLQSDRASVLGDIDASAPFAHASQTPRLLIDTSGCSDKFSTKKNTNSRYALPSPAVLIAQPDDTRLGGTQPSWPKGPITPPTPFADSIRSTAQSDDSEISEMDIESSYIFVTPSASASSLASQKYREAQSSAAHLTSSPLDRRSSSGATGSSKGKKVYSNATSFPFPAPLTPPLTPRDIEQSQLSHDQLVEQRRQQEQHEAKRLLQQEREREHREAMQQQQAFNQGAPLTPAITPPAATFGETHQQTTVSGRALATYRMHPRFAAQYTIVEELGAGGFGFVVRAIRNVDGANVAVKFIYRDKVPSHGWVKIKNWDGGHGGQAAAGDKLIPMEAYVLRAVRHPGVVGFVDLFEDSKYFYLIMEHHGTPWQAPEKTNNTTPCSLPSLASAVAGKQTVQSPSTLNASLAPDSSPLALKSSSLTSVRPSAPKMMSAHSLSPPAAPPMIRRSSCDLFECIEQHSRFGEDTARYIFAQVVDVVHYLAGIGVQHRDLKDENIVVDMHFRVKLIDFGSAVISDPRKPPPFYNRFYGTVNFASAEILRGEAYRSQPAEVWSLGILLSILITGESPFSDPLQAIAGKMNKPKAPMSHDCQNLLAGCLQTNPDARMTIEQVKDHPWVRGYRSRQAVAAR